MKPSRILATVCAAFLVAFIPLPALSSFDPPTPYSFGAAGNGVADDTAAFQAWLASGAKHLHLPMPVSGGFYKVSAKLTIPDGVIIEGVGGRLPKIKNVAASDHVLSFYGLTGATLRNIAIDGESALKSSGSAIVVNDSDNVILEDIAVEDTKSDGISIFNGSRDITLNRVTVTGSLAHGVSVSNTERFRLHDVSGSGNTQFVVYLGDGAKYGIVDAPMTHSNSRELLVATRTASHNVIMGGIATGTGDNGFSFIGDKNAAVGLVSAGNSNNGFGLGGTGNALAGLVASNNNQANNGYAGVRVAAGWGGEARSNSVAALSGSSADGKQAYAYEEKASVYQAWAQGQTVTLTADPWRIHNGNVYQATTGGTTGATAPTHTSGTASDGGVPWQYVLTTSADRMTTGNRPAAVSGDGNAQAVSYQR